MSFAAAEAMAPKTASSTYSSSEDERQVCGFYSIKKYYDGGPTVNEGYFKIKVRKVEMTEDFFVHNYELCCPIFKHGEYLARDITLGVKPDSAWQLWDGNGVASLLFNQNLCGDVVFTFESKNKVARTLVEMRSFLSEHMDEEELASAWQPESDESAE